MTAFGGAAHKRSMLAASFARPYPVTVPMVVLMALVPLYLFIPGAPPGRPQFLPELALDRRLPLVPAWAIVYGTAYLFLIVLPVLVVRQRAHIRRMYLAYLSVWVTAYLGFLLLPTVAPRPASVTGVGFMLLASIAYVLFLRGCRREHVAELDRQVAPVMAVAAAGIAGLATACLWLAYRLTAS